MPKDSGRSIAKSLPYTRSEPYARSTLTKSQEAKKQSKLGLWPRIKSYFWGKSEPAGLGPPRLTIQEDNEDLSRITHSSVNYSLRDGKDYGDNSDSVSKLRNCSQIEAPVSEINNSLNDSSYPLGPNEALRQFFAEKGDAELNNLEIAGALSLIGQAVSRNESLVDFSTYSRYSNTQVDPTPDEASILRSLNAPPYPRPFWQGTPPPRARSSLTSRSPWTSPRPSNLRNEDHSSSLYRSTVDQSTSTLNRTQNPLFGNPNPRNPLQSRKMDSQSLYSRRTSNAFGLNPPVSSRASLASSSATNSAPTTAAASVIMRALDKPAAKPFLSRDVRKARMTGNRVNESGSDEMGDNSAIEAGDELEVDSISEPNNLSETKVDSAAMDIGSDEAKVSSEDRPKADSVSSDKSSPEVLSTYTSSSAPGLFPATSTRMSYSADALNPAPDVQSDKFHFTIPSPRVPVEMTPDEEVIVAQSRSEFTF